MLESSFKKTLIIGLGLIGGSFARSLKSANLSKEIFAYDPDEDSVLNAIEEKIINGSFSIQNDLSNFDFIVIACPLNFYKEIFLDLKKTIAKHTIIIDLGSLKSFTKEVLPKELEENFVACHPIAGLEKSGFSNSSVELFKDKKFIICTQNENSKTVKILAEKIGFIVEFLDAKLHDEIYALISHLPQFLSFLSKDFVSKDIENEFFKNAFRLDNSSPKLWESIFKLNAKNLEKFYLEFFDNLIDFIENLESPSFNINDFKLDCLESEHSKPNCHLEQSERSLEFYPQEISRFAQDDGWAGYYEKNLAENEKFLEENFAPIFFRFLMVISYLKINKIKEYKSFAGSGFKDFTSIAAIINYDEKKLLDLIKKNHTKIIKIFDSIS